MDNLSLILSSFSPISLEEMDRVKLLDRVDTKFIVHEDQLPEYLAAVNSQYSLLNIAGVSVHPYETLYFDTPDYNLYRMHHNGRRNRFKLRCRKYVNSGIAYFEIKSKTNTRRTIKKRMRIDTIPETLNETLVQYIGQHIPGNYNDFVPSLRVFFDRLTFVNKLANERLTIDLNLRYETNGEGKKIEKIAIVEVKQEKHSVSPFRQLMKKQRQRNNYLSKYCLGLICLVKGIKMNRFQQKINSLTKLGYDI
jgi:hypothetical protein